MNSTESPPIPESITTEDALSEVMTRPSAELCEFAKTLDSPLVILGAAGKMGPSLAVQLRRAANSANKALEIIAVSRFSDEAARRWLDQREITTVSCDLLDRASLSKLPDAPNVIYLVGLKFGTAQNPSLTWAVNAMVPTHASERYSRSRFAALSTGNVYPVVPVRDGGSVETDPATPIGEYANAAVARERIFEYHSRKVGIPITVLRLNYAVDLRYGVLLEIAQTVWAGKPVDVTMGYFNCIWQGDANDMIVRALALAESPPGIFNLTGPDILSVRNIAERFGALMHRTVEFTGEEAPTALLSNPSKMRQCLGNPRTPLDTVLKWTADWVMRGGATYGKATHFQVRDGKY